MTSSMLEPPLRIPVGNCWGRDPVASLDGTMYLLGDENPQTGCRVACYDRNGSFQWDRRYPSLNYPFDPVGPLRLAHDDTLWLGSANRIYRVVPPSHPDPLPLDLTPLVRLDEGEQLGTFLVLPDGFLVIFDHPPRNLSLPLTPRVARLDQAGNVRWSVELPVQPGERFTGSYLHGQRLPATWSVDSLLLAGRHVLASFGERRSGAGRSYCLDVTTGALLWTEERHAGWITAIAGHDRFLVDGRILYGGGGSVQCRSGPPRYVVIGRDDHAIRFIRMRHRNMTYPVLTAQGHTLYWCNGSLRMVAADLRKKELVAEYSQAGEGRAWSCYSRLLLLPDGTLACNISRYKDNVFSSELVLVRTEYRLSSGWWPCGEGGLGSNPVVVVPPASQDKVL